MVNNFNFNTQSIQWLLTNLNTLLEETNSVISGSGEYIRTLATPEYMNFVDTLPLGTRIHFKKLIMIPQTNAVLPMPTVKIFERGLQLPSIDIELTGVIQTLDENGTLHYNQTYCEFNDFIFTVRKTSQGGDTPSQITPANCQLYIEYKIL